MREELYAGIDLGPALDDAVAPLDRLRLWMRAYRAATARVPAVVPVLVGAPVEDLRTLEIYEALFVILRDAGVPVEQRVACSAMVDALVLGSAVDAGSPAPLGGSSALGVGGVNELVGSSVAANVPAGGSSVPVEANVPGSSAVGVGGGATAPNGAVS